MRRSPWTMTLRRLATAAATAAGTGKRRAGGCTASAVAAAARPPGALFATTTVAAAAAAPRSFGPCAHLLSASSSPSLLGAPRAFCNWRSAAAWAPAEPALEAALPAAEEPDVALDATARAAAADDAARAAAAAAAAQSSPPPPPPAEGPARYYRERLDEGAWRPDPRQAVTVELLQVSLLARRRRSDTGGHRATFSPRPPVCRAPRCSRRSSSPPGSPLFP